MLASENFPNMNMEIFVVKGTGVAMSYLRAQHKENISLVEEL